MEVRGNRSFRLKVHQPEVVSPKPKSMRPIFILLFFKAEKGISVKR